MENCNTENNKCCAMKMICKAACFLSVVFTLVIMTLLYQEIRRVNNGLNELNTEIGYVAEYLDSIKGNIKMMNDNSKALKEDVAEIKNKEVLED